LSAHSNNYVYLFDTTLRDGAQTRGVDFSVKDKTALAGWLDDFGIDYVEGGWPGANPTDSTFFAAPPALRHARFTAFGMMRRNGRSAENDPGLQDVLNAADHVCLVGKNWDRHVTEALGVSLEQNLDCIATSIALGVKRGKEVLYDAEHFFDGYKSNPGYAVACLRTAQDAGASWLVLCDTNGGSLPHEVFEIVGKVRAALPGANLGIHAHNDCGCAVANSLQAARAGCRMVQGTLNGLGERCGNADLIAIIPLLARMGHDTGISAENMAGLTRISRALDTLLDRAPDEARPFVGRRAFAHKGGLHASAVGKNPELYEHATPETFGNVREIVMSDQAGRASAVLRLRTMGFPVDEKDPRLTTIVERIKEREGRGFSYDNAPESFALLAMEILDPSRPAFAIVRFRASDTVAFGKAGPDGLSRARVTVQIGDHAVSKTATGDGPVHAVDVALREALTPHFPVLQSVRLSDYHVRILDTQSATAATTRVSVEMEDTRSGMTWRTMGVSPNVVTASVEALCDGYEYLLRFVEPRRNSA
jgi:2-isopropylmalate synthase